MPGVPGATVVTTRVLPTHCTRGCGCNGHPAFPTPSVGRKIQAQLGRIAPRECGPASLHFKFFGCLKVKSGSRLCLIVEIFLRASEQMDDAGRRDGDEYEA